MPRVLLVDDDDMVRDALRLALEASGMNVVERADGDIANALDGIDVVVTDIIMPNADGLDVIIRAGGGASGIPVIAISAGGRLSGIDYQDIAGKMGAAAYFPKPVNENDLIAKINELVASAPSP